MGPRIVIKITKRSFTKTLNTEKIQHAPKYMNIYNLGNINDIHKMYVA